jgi:hypothetical protein
VFHKGTFSRRFFFVLWHGAPTLRALTLIRNEDIMPAATATKTRPPPEPRAEPRLFHARMLVTRAEEWCVEAETPEQARELLAAGAGHRCTPGESVQVELDRLLDQ